MSDQQQTESAVLCYRWQTYWPHAVPNVLDVQSTPERKRVTCHVCLHALGSQRHDPPAPQVCTNHERCCKYLLCAHPKCCGYFGKVLTSPEGSH
jgi:hypothetical protein